MYKRQVTPTAKRNSVRVARLVGQLPRVACFARNPELGNRNSYRVVAACGEAIPMSLSPDIDAS